MNCLLHFSIDRKHFLYRLMISRLKTILILGSQTLETFMVSTISEIPVDQLVRRKLSVS